MGGAHESPEDCIAAGITPNECATGPPVRLRSLGAGISKAVWNGVAQATETTGRVLRRDALNLEASQAEGL
ncbi:MAG: hypothetical protein NTNFB01_20930 [Nitrospira sp.]